MQLRQTAQIRLQLMMTVYSAENVSKLVSLMRLELMTITSTVRTATCTMQGHTCISKGLVTFHFLQKNARHAQSVPKTVRLAH